LIRTLGIAFVVVLASGCGAGGGQSNAAQSVSPAAGASASAPTTSPSPTPPSASSSPASGDALVKCEDMPQQTYTSENFRFTIACPTNFSWQTLRPIPGRLFDARSVDDKYLNGYPAGQVEISVAVNGGNSLSDWVASHIGRAGSGDANHFWDSISNSADIQIAGRPAIGFDYVLVGPESPVNFHAAAFVLPEGSMFLIDWWAYSSDYAPAIASVAQQMIASVQPFGA
jgi:hypothetical protein